MFAAWDPLTDPTFAVAQLKRLRRHFLIDKQLAQAEDRMDLDIYNGSASHSNGGSSKKGTDRTMTAYETMMWTIWLPRVRSAIKFVHCLSSLVSSLVVLADLAALQ